jgi:hypothetical protein
MRWMVRHANGFAALTMLACCGAGIGMAWSSMTQSAVVWHRPAQIAEPMTEPGQGIDQFAAGRSWAQAAYDGGLRRCPEMNADFVAACQAEMKALAARPDFAPGSYGGPLLVTSYTPPVDEALVDVAEPLPAAEPAPAIERPEPTVIPAAMEATPDNYPAAPAEPL